MAFSGPLRSEVLRYGKRKRLSLDGSIPGVMYTRRRGDPASAPLPSAAAGQLYEEPLPTDYAPHAGHMHFSGPTYDPPDFLQGSGPLTSLHFGAFPGGAGPADPPDMIPDPVSYEAMLMVDRVVEEMRQEWQALHDEAFGIALPDDPGARPIDEMFHAPAQLTDESGYDGAEMTQELFDQQMALAHGASPSGLPVDAFGEPGAPADAMQDPGLEAIVNDAESPVPPCDELQPDRYLMDPFEDPLLRQMMDPFGMLGMGPM